MAPERVQGCWVQAIGGSLSGTAALNQDPPPPVCRDNDDSLLTWVVCSNTSMNLLLVQPADFLISGDTGDGLGPEPCNHTPTAGQDAGLW